jgi:hypothetical protein
LVLDKVLLQVIQELQGGGTAIPTQDQGHRLFQALEHDWNRARRGGIGRLIFCVYASVLLAHLSDLPNSTLKRVKGLSKTCEGLLDLGGQKLMDLFRLACEAETFVVETELLEAWTLIKPKLEQEVEEKEKGAWALMDCCSMS